MPNYYLYFLYMLTLLPLFFFFFFNDTATTEIYTLSLHDALPISRWIKARSSGLSSMIKTRSGRLIASLSGFPMQLRERSEEHTSELQSPCNLVCRLLLEKKKNKICSNQKFSDRDKQCNYLNELIN